MVSPWRFRPGARSTSTTCVSVDFRHATSARRLPSFAVTANSVGGVASYLNSWEAPPTLRALSVHEPVSDARGLSGPAYCEAAEHEAIPDVGSVPENETVSARLYQPFASGARSTTAETDGGLLSILIVTVCPPVPPSLTAVQANCVPAVSAVSVLESQPVVERMVDSGSTMLQFSVTVARHHPLAGFAGEYTGVTTGGVGSPRTPPAPCGSTNMAASAPAKTVRRKILRRTLRRSNPGLTRTCLPPVAWWCFCDATPGAGKCQSGTDVSGRGRRAPPPHQLLFLS